jgi:hydroxymethylpyrimidine pyrophosphatase-like HAD family hydrolase
VGSAEAVAAAHRALIAAGFPVTVARSKPIYLEVTAALAAKAAAALWLLGQWGLPAASAMAIGDGENDVGLLQAVGIGIAMGNAPASVKQAARYVTGSNDDDGVATALDRWLFNP